MELIKELSKKWLHDYTKYKSRIGLFNCGYCNKEIEREYHVGLVSKSCGCSTDKINRKNASVFNNSRQRTIFIRNNVYSANIK